MRAYTILIVLLMATAAAGQAVTITLSLSETKSISPNDAVIGQNFPSYGYYLGVIILANQVKIDYQQSACGWYPIFNCGRSLCVSLGGIPKCQQVNNNAGTLTFNNLGTGNQITVSYSGGGPSYLNPNHFVIKKITYTGGATAQKIQALQTFKGTTPVDFGRVSQNIPTAGFQGTVNIASNNPKVLAWFDDQTGYSDPTRKSTTTFTDDVLACYDGDQRGTCDYIDEYNCALQDSDYYYDRCCGDAPYNPLNDCSYFLSPVNALCGKQADNKWKWTALEDIGEISIRDGSCPTIQLVSDGTNFHTCNQQIIGINNMPAISKITGTLNILGHDYVCDGENIMECGGNTPYSSGAKQTGDVLAINNQNYYCGSNGKWKQSLDDDKDACQASGNTWTGTKCCGEPDDTLKSYQDTYAGTGTAGSCYNNQFIPSGDFLSGNKQVLNHRGNFHICAPTGISTTEAQALFTGTGISPTMTTPCGNPLQNTKLTGTYQHAICMPYGEWKFISSTEPHLFKQTKWQAQSGEKQQGCCPDAQCWDGITCRNTGEYYIIGDKGYRCE